MKKIIASLILSLGLVTCSQAASATATITGGTTANISGAGATKVTLLSIAALTNDTTIALYDSPNGALSYTTAAYSNIVSYATNWIQTWTNYYGMTNSWTNISLVDITNSVPAATTLYQVVATVTVASNTTYSINPANYTFLYGLYATNKSAAPSLGAVTVNYVK